MEQEQKETKKNFIYSCKYQEERNDLRLMLIYFVKKSLFIVYGLILGAILFGGYYHYVTYIQNGQELYVTKANLYLDYSDQVRIENVYLNDYTWGELIKTDMAMDYSLSLLEPKEGITREELEQSVDASLESDLRFVILTVTNEDPELAVEIAKVFEQTIIYIGEQMDDIDSVTIYTEADEAKLMEVENRMPHMILCGAIVGAIFGCLFVFFLYFIDDSVFVPSSFEKRFRIPVLGIFLKGIQIPETTQEEEQEFEGWQKKRIYWSMQVFLENCVKLFGDCKKVGFVDLDSDTDCAKILAIMKPIQKEAWKEIRAKIFRGEIEEAEAKGFGVCELKGVTSPRLDLREAMAGLKSCDGVVIAVKAGARNGRALERDINLLMKQECNIIGAILYDADVTTMGMYYFPKHAGRKHEEANAEERTNGESK